MMKMFFTKKYLLCVRVYTTATLAASLAFVSGLFSSAALAGRHYTFDVSQLDGGGKNVDISLLEDGAQLPGTYHVDVILNGDLVDSRDMRFLSGKAADGSPFLYTCLTREQLVSYGVKVDSYPGLFTSGQSREGGDGARKDDCARISAIPQASEKYVFYSQQLLLSIPQIALRPQYTGIAPTSLWNDGITAFLMNYQASTFHSEFRGGGMSSAADSMDVQLEPGLNLGAWRLRNLSSWQKQSLMKGQWQTSYTYAERGLYGLKSRLSLGERFSPSDVFDGIPFRGVMIGSDENMVSYSQRSFAPVVKGIARTHARIEVKQNGYVIYNTTVAPGPFAITDLPATDGSGDLQVTVFEADGTRQAFTVPYTTPALSLRQGYLKYNIMAGQYRPAISSVDRSPVAQATVMYGLPLNLTVYGGGQWARHYQAGAFGMGVSLGSPGAVSVDGVLSRAQMRAQSVTQGQSWRVRYSKSFDTTGTGISVAGYLYSPQYHSLSGVLDSYYSGNNPYPYVPWAPVQDTPCYPDNRDFGVAQKSLLSVTLSQPLGAWGGLSFSGSQGRFRYGSRHQTVFSARYSSPLIQGISWSLDWTQSLRVSDAYTGTRGRGTDRSVSLWVNIPFRRAGENSSVSYQMQNVSGQGTLHSVGLNGEAFNQQLFWNVNQQMTQGDNHNQNSSDLLLRWNGAYGSVGVGYGYRKNGKQINASTQGSVVIHRHGVTFGQRLGNSSALIEAPGAGGVAVINAVGVKTDFRGYTTLGDLAPYQENTVSLDPLTLPANVAIPQTDIRVVPTEGAIVPATFVTRTGGRALIRLTQMNGQPVPFGAVADLVGPENTQSNTGIVGDSGEVYMTGLPENGQLQVQWGYGQQQRCRAVFRLQKGNGHENAGVAALQAQCR